MIDKRSLLTLFVIATVLLAGCSALSGGGTPSSKTEGVESSPSTTESSTPATSGAAITNAHSRLVAGQPALVFNYSVSDYSEILFQRPDGNVVSRGTLEPNQSAGTFLMRSPEAGTYKLIIQKGGETAVQENVTFEGGLLSVESTSANWSSNSLQSATMTVRNRGDLPVQLSDPSVSVRGSGETQLSSTWLGPNETETVTVSPSFGEVTIEEPGSVRGRITAETRQGDISGTFQTEFEGANLSVEDYRTNWQGGTLNSVSVTVRNSGELPTDGEAIVQDSGEILAESLSKTIKADRTTTFEIDHSIYEQTTSGSVDLSLVVNSSDGFVEETISHTVTGPNLSVQHVRPVWENGRLQNVIVEVENDGEIDGSASVSAAVEGVDIGTDQIDVPAENSITYEFGSTNAFADSLFTATTGGVKTVEVTLDGPSEQNTTSASQTFDGVETSLSGVDVTAFDEYDSNKQDLSTMSFTVQNTGDVPLQYDTVEFSIASSTQSDSPYSTEVVEPGGSKQIYLYPDGVLVDPGSHELTIRFRIDGQVVGSTTTTVSVE